MKKLRSYYMHLRHHKAMDRKWIFPLAIGSIVSILLLFLATLASSDGSPFLPFYRSFPASRSVFVESKLMPLPISSLPPPPRFAYLISGSAGDGKMLKRTLQALYHPQNRYVVHLDRESSPEERLDLRNLVRNNPVFVKFGNVWMITIANLVTYRGPTMVSNTLHAAAILLRKGGNWDWFINLSASDYPLVSQDGFAWMALSRPFIDYCIWGWDNLPRTVLMYYANFLSSPEGYFHTVIRNAPEFRNTTVNTDLHFISWDNPPKQHPHHLTLDHMNGLIESNAPFARKFRQDDPVLDKIDSDLLFRGEGMFVPGGWCIGSGENGSDPCTVIGDTTVLRPSPGAKRLESLISSQLSNDKFRPRQCK